VGDSVVGANEGLVDGEDDGEDVGID